MFAALVVTIRPRDALSTQALRSSPSQRGSLPTLSFVLRQLHFRYPTIPTPSVFRQSFFFRIFLNFRLHFHSLSSSCSCSPSSSCFSAFLVFWYLSAQVASSSLSKGIRSPGLSRLDFVLLLLSRFVARGAYRIRIRTVMCGASSLSVF